MDKIGDCSFYYFKEKSGKWKYEGRGIFPKNAEVDEEAIVRANDMKLPGLSVDHTDLVIVVIPDEDCVGEFTFPRMILPRVNAPLDRKVYGHSQT